MFLLEVFDFEFHRYGPIENYSFAQYERPALGTGSFTIKCDANIGNIFKLKDERIIWFEDDVAGIIQYVNFSDRESSTLEVKGKLLTEMLNWRYIYPAINAIEQPINRVMEKYVRDNCVSPTDSKRKFNNFEIINSDFEMHKISKMKTGGSIEEAIEELAYAEGFIPLLRYNVGFFPREHKFKFYISKGLDRTKGNKEGNHLVLFSKDLRNIIQSKYTLNSESYRNAALVAGEGDDKGRTTKIVYTDNVEVSGFDRREMFVDARDLQSKGNDDNGNEVKLSPEEYNSLLVQRGNEKLGSQYKVESYEGEVRSDYETTFVYNKDYFLGDKVDIIDDKIGIKLSAMITMVTVTQDDSGYTIEPTFGYNQETIAEKINNLSQSSGGQFISESSPDGKYLPLTGGVLTGGLEIESPNGLKTTGVIQATKNTTHEFGSLENEGGTIVKCSANGAATSLYTAGSSKDRGIYDSTMRTWTIVRNNSDGQVYIYDKDKIGRMLGEANISMGNANIPSSGAVYNALPTINGEKAGSTIYAPVTAGAKGYMPVSGGSGAPGWKSPLSMTALAKDNITVGKQSHKGGTIDIPSDADYEVVAVGGFSITNATTSGVNSSKCFFGKLYTSKTTVTYQINNYHTADAKVKIIVYLIRRPITT